MGTKITARGHLRANQSKSATTKKAATSVMWLELIPLSQMSINQWSSFGGELLFRVVLTICHATLDGLIFAGEETSFNARIRYQSKALYVYLLYKSRACNHPKFSYGAIPGICDGMTVFGVTGGVTAETRVVLANFQGYGL